MSLNQDYALARWREDAARNDPPFYSTREVCGHVCVWMNINGNVGWYWPEITAGEVTEMHALGFGGHDSLIHLLNPKQKRKIAALP